MPKFSTKVSTKAFQTLRDKLIKLKRAPIDAGTANRVGRTTTRQMKGMIARGRSPIAGKGAFGAYRGGYRDRIRKGQLKNKSLRPVNLKLNGKFLRSLKHAVKRGFGGFETGFFYQGADQKKKEKGHREGARGQAKRPTLPIGTEKFAKPITSSILKIYVERLNRLLKDLK